ncbi:uncharacterized protein LOC124262273 [Haliotis rubra]|uniref:uncharacterized protein LOC124262273 n=1 Tax=Haliotis rubra TaxID=36100 RepID=UPI001EE5A88D|nr:uncharacterized protein LOC124262273 [Haliotis rubra]
MSRVSVSWLHRTVTGFIYTLVAFAGAIEKTCSPLSQLAVVENARLTGAVFDTVATSGVVTCAKECLSRLACKSYNFHLDDGTCELNTDGTAAVFGVERFVFSLSQIWPQGILGACKDHNCPLNTRCVEVGRNASKCVVTYCSDPPTVKNATSTSPISNVIPVDQSVQLECIVGYVPCGNVTCKPDGTWTNMTCKCLSSCQDVLDLNSNYADGEYWLYPQPLNGDRVKVYCHDMKNTPREYITLTTPYIMDAPFIRNLNCTGNDTSYDNNFLGKHVYSKFGLDIETMAIFKSDQTFYNKTGVMSAAVGSVRDCYSENCGPVGRAVIDLRGTGLSVSDSVTWKKITRGWAPIVNRSLGGQLIEIRCGGDCGACSVGSLSLSLIKTDAPAENSATTPTCAP